MNYEKIECSDLGTEFCPCHLADKGECLICSQLQGKCFCDCTNWNGVCIYQEFITNKSKPKNLRDIFSVKIIEKALYEENLLKLIVLAPHKLVMNLVNPGAYVFVKSDEYNNYFDFPISIEKADTDMNTLTFYIEIRGIKTKSILNLEVNDNLFIRAPYFNGIFGVKNINETKNEKCLILGRGVGIAPSNPVINKLFSQNNELEIIYDIAPFQNNYFNTSFDKKIKLSINEYNFIKNGEISEQLKSFLKKQIDLGVTFIHCGGADILIYKIIEFLDSINKTDIKLSCCNNSKMCCGEGICGSCTVRFKGHIVKRFCKLQADPRNIFKGRRFI